MNRSLFFMMTLLVSLSLFAGIGGSSGGANSNSTDNNGSHYTTEICETNEAGVQMNCHRVEFNRNLGVPSKYQEPVICGGEAQNTICDNPNARVPELLNKINNWFRQRGFTSPQMGNQ